MSEFIRWWLVLQLAGFVLLPLCVVLFRRLPDRGYSLSKPFALLTLGFTFWFLNSVRLLPNSAAGIIIALLLLAALSAWFVYRERDDMQAWAEGNWPYVLGVEALLLVTFAGAAILRSYVPEVSGTEQPMDLMFLNAATQAEHFPPKDPWLSGHTVAYYYFGYLIVAMVGQVASVPTEIGYNLGLAMIASLAFVGAAGLVYNLVQMHEDADGDSSARDKHAVRERRARLPGWRAPVFGVAGGLLLVVAGNLAFVFMFTSAWGWGGKGFYEWVDISGLSGNERAASWYPSEFFSFFNASRIYQIDDVPGGDDFRAITEFPMFSFVLGDLHPHVMALPFVLVVLGLALTLYRTPEPLDITFWLQRPLMLLGSAVLLGGLAFINTWDVATMLLAILAAAFVSNYRRASGWNSDLIVQIVSFAVPLIVLSFVAYAPFLVSIAGNSQADGVGAVVTRPGVNHPGTRPLHLLIFWGTLFVLVLPFVAHRLWVWRERITTARAAWAAALPAGIVVAWALWYGFQRGCDNITCAGTDERGIADAFGFWAQIGDRGTGWLTAIFLGVALAASLLALWLEATSREPASRREGAIFVLCIGSLSLLLILGTEFFYIGDVFHNRMNTVFKLYYQAWMLLAVAGGFALYYLLGTPRTLRFVWGGAVAIVLAGAALYPLGATANRIRPDTGGDALVETPDRGLRGLRHFPESEQRAIAWLRERSKGQDLVIAEAVGGDYTLASRISAATGAPTILGWGGHEDQWRGGTTEARAGRFEDVTLLYQTTDMTEVRRIVEKYGVTYIYVGDLERSTYGEAALAKFQSLPVAFTSGGVTIYRTRGIGEAEAAR